MHAPHMHEIYNFKIIYLLRVVSELTFSIFHEFIMQFTIYNILIFQMLIFYFFKSTYILF